MASLFFKADACLALVRPEHTAFYRRVFGSEEMSDVRIYPGLAFPVALYGAYVDTKLPATLRRYPFFMSTEEEREKLFARAMDEHFEARSARVRGWPMSGRCWNRSLVARRSSGGR